jgi:hypothetical protein
MDFAGFSRITKDINDWIAAFMGMDINGYLEENS